MKTVTTKSDLLARIASCNAEIGRAEEIAAVSRHQLHLCANIKRAAEAKRRRCKAALQSGKAR